LVLLVELPGYRTFSDPVPSSQHAQLHTRTHICATVIVL